MTAVRLFSTLAVQSALCGRLLPSFCSDVATTFDPTGVLGDRIEKGEPFDLIIAVDSFLTGLETEGVITRPMPLVSTGIGVAVLSGAALPAIDTLDALKATLTSARSVAYSRTGASGIYFAELLERLGIAEAVNSRSTILPKGFTAEAIVDGRADLAIQQISELLSVKGVDLVGPIPREVQATTGFSVALSRSARDPRAAAALLAHLTSRDAAVAYRRSGLEVCWPTSA